MRGVIEVVPCHEGEALVVRGLAASQVRQQPKAEQHQEVQYLAHRSLCTNAELAVLVDSSDRPSG